MLKDEAKKQYQRDYMKRKRSNKGSNIEAEAPRVGSNIGSNKAWEKKMEGLTQGCWKKGMDGPEVLATTKGTPYPDIIDKLTDPAWRGALERICEEFSGSPYAKDVRVGVYGPDLVTVSELLEVTSG